MSYRQGSLGFSLKPPSWLRSIASGITGAVTTSGGTTIARSSSGQVTVTPGGQDLMDTTGAKLQAGVQSIPGGWVTIAAAAVVGLLLFKRAAR